jgi:Flp pilus assembly protein TadD
MAHRMQVLHRAGIPCLLFLLALGVFAGALGNDFTNWDDDKYVTGNALIERLDRDHLREMFRLRSARGAYSAPLTLLSYALDHALWKKRAFGYHLTNLLLHALCTVLLYVLLRKVLGRGDPDSGTVPSTVAAALFAIHPVQVESVAWISERKNLLAMTLLIASFLAWLSATRRPFGGGAYAAFLLLLTGALLAKIQAVVLPPLLLAYEWIERPARPEDPAPLRTRLLLLAPAFAIALLMGVLSLEVYQVAEEKRMTGDLLGAIATSPVLILGYVKDLLFPMNRAAILTPAVYDAPWQAVPLAAWILLLVWLIGVTVLRRSRPHPAFFSLWFVVALLPVLNLVPLPVLAADRYQYWAAPGLLALAGLGVAALWRRLAATRKYAAATVVVAVAGLLAALTVARVKVWENSSTLWTDAVRKAPFSAEARRNLGGTLIQAGKMQEAEREFREAIRMDPGYGRARTNLGLSLLAQGKFREAEGELREALRLDPYNVSARSNFAVVLYAIGKKKEAASEIREVLRLEPRHARARGNLGTILYELGETEEAEQQLQAALRLDPHNPKTRRALGGALLKQGKLEEAERHLLEALRARPGDTGAIHDLARIAARRGDARRALDLLERLVDQGYGGEPLASDPDLAPLRQQPRFQALLRKLRESER